MYPHKKNLTALSLETVGAKGMGRYYQSIYRQIKHQACYLRFFHYVEEHHHADKILAVLHQEVNWQDTVRFR